MPTRFALLPFAAFALVACGPPESTTLPCGAGTVAQGDACVVAPSGCAPGTHLDGGACEPDPVDAGPSCGPGTHASNGFCVPDTAGDGGLTDPTTWSANVRVATDVDYSAEPQMAVDSHGNVFVAMMFIGPGARGYGVALYKSTDGGHTFARLLAHTPDTASDFLGDTTLAVDREDRVYWGWIHYASGSRGVTTGNVFASISTDGGTTFGMPQQVNDPTDTTDTFSDRPWFSLAPDGSMYMSWTNGEPISMSEPSSIGARYARSQGGMPFGPQQTIFDPPVSPYVDELEESPLAFTATGDPIAASSRYEYTSSGTAYSVNAWTSSAGAFSSTTVTDVVAGQHFMFETYPLIASDGAGNLELLFLNGFSRQVTPWVVRSTDGGATWSMPAEVSGGALPASDAAIPWLTFDDRGRVHAMWLDNRNGAWVPYTAWSTDGAHFSAAERVGDATFVEDGTSQKWIGDFLSIIPRGDHRYAVWTDTRSGRSQVFFASAPMP